jgi:hypothetical protein
MVLRHSSKGRSAALVARSYSRRFAVMTAGIFLSALAADSRLFRIARAISRSAARVVVTADAGITAIGGAWSTT